MTAIAIRNKSDQSLVCFGPNNGMYSPGYDASTMERTIEDYVAVLTEWQSKPAVASERQTAKMSLKNVKSMAELLIVLEKLV